MTAPEDNTRGDLPVGEIVVGDAAATLATFPDNSVDTAITSPPYFRLRDYQNAGQIGLEDAVTDWADRLNDVIAEISRVLTPTGSLWLNLADTYSRHTRHGAAPKSLVLGPERVALAMIENGWSVRNKVIWAKPNPMPASVKDRLACTWETVYFATRARQYFFDLDAIRIPHRTRPSQRQSRPAASTQPQTSRPSWAGPSAGSNSGLSAMKASGRVGHRLGKNPGDVWTIPTSNYRGAHFATFPPRLIEAPILATCPKRVCRRCDTPWQPRTSSSGDSDAESVLVSRCGCVGSPSRRGIVLDPFAGAGTVALAADRLDRDWVGIEINAEYAALARDRITTARNAANADIDLGPDVGVRAEAA